MKGACFDDAMAHLSGLGLRDVAHQIGADALALELRAAIIKQFRSNLDRLNGVSCLNPVAAWNSYDFVGAEGDQLSEISTVRGATHSETMGVDLQDGNISMQCGAISGWPGIDYASSDPAFDIFPPISWRDCVQ